MKNATSFKYSWQDAPNLWKKKKEMYKNDKLSGVKVEHALIQDNEKRKFVKIRKSKQNWTELCDVYSYINISIQSFISFVFALH